MIRFVGNIFLILFGIGTAQSLWKLIFLASLRKSLFAFSIGFGVYCIIWIFFLRNRETFWSILEHELIHAVTAILFGKKIRSLKAHRSSGGSVIVEGGNIWIALAPYFLPLPALLAAFFLLFIQQNYLPYLQGLVGFLLGFHLFPLFKEFHLTQPDIQQTGIVLSLLLTITGNLFFTGVIIALLPGKWGLLESFVVQTGVAALQLSINIINYLHRRFIVENFFSVS